MLLSVFQSEGNLKRNHNFIIILHFNVNIVFLKIRMFKNLHNEAQPADDGIRMQTLYILVDPKASFTY